MWSMRCTLSYTVAMNSRQVALHIYMHVSFSCCASEVKPFELCRSRIVVYVLLFGGHVAPTGIMSVVG